MSMQKNSVQFLSSVAQLYLTLCDPVTRSTPGLPVHHQLPESTQTHVHTETVDRVSMLFKENLYLTLHSGLPCPSWWH